MLQLDPGCVMGKSQPCVPLHPHRGLVLPCMCQLGGGVGASPITCMGSKEWGWMDGWTDGQMDRRMSRWEDEWMKGWR